MYLLESGTKLLELGNLRSGTIARPSGIDAKREVQYLFSQLKCKNSYSLTIFISLATTRNTVTANRLLSGF